MRSSGNSFATAHISGICALILAKHPELTPFELKSVLRLTAANVQGGQRLSEERACAPRSPPRRWPARSAQRELLRSIVEVARAIFEAKAASIMLSDEEADELVFEAVSGEGSETLIGRRFPASEGIAGWVLSSREPLVLDDVEQDPRFSRDVAEQPATCPRG